MLSDKHALQLPQNGEVGLDEGCREAEAHPFLRADRIYYLQLWAKEGTLHNAKREACSILD